MSKKKVIIKKELTFVRDQIYGEVDGIYLTWEEALKLYDFEGCECEITIEIKEENDDRTKDKKNT